MFENTIFVLLVSLVAGSFILNQWISILNDKSAISNVPDELKNVYDAEQYKKSQAYHRANAKHGWISGAFSFVLLICCLFLGWFGDIDEWVRSFAPNSWLVPFLFFGVLFIINDFLLTPFVAYQQFVIEERFRFNRTTIKTFLLDKLKSYIITFLIGGLLLFIFLFLVLWLEKSFWVYFWVVMILFVLLANLLYTSWILPLFNKLTPLENGSLKSSIVDYCKTVHFPLTNIFVMDGSKRSSKGNAFFSGMGKSKKIVLFDSLISNHSDDELLAIIAHEVGHYKKRHLVTGMVFTSFFLGVMLFLLSLVLFNHDVSFAIGGITESIHLNLVAFGILYSPISLFLGTVGNYISRKNEFEADSFAKTTSSADALVTALKKLSRDNLSNLTPHKLYVFFNYSHPTLLQRIRALKK